MPRVNPAYLRRLAQEKLAAEAKKIGRKVKARIDVYEEGGLRVVFDNHPCPDAWLESPGFNRSASVIKSFSAAQVDEAEAFAKARAKQLVPLLPELAPKPVRPGSGRSSGSAMDLVMNRTSLRERLARKSIPNELLLAGTGGYRSDADLSPAFEPGTPAQDLTLLTEEEINSQAEKLGLTPAQRDAVLSLHRELAADKGGVAELGSDGPGGVIVALLVLAKRDNEPTVVPVIIEPNGELAVTEELNSTVKTRRNPLSDRTPAEQRELDGEWALRQEMSGIVQQAARRGGEFGAPVLEPSEAAIREQQGRSSARTGFSEEEKRWAQDRLAAARRRGGPNALERPR